MSTDLKSSNGIRNIMENQGILNLSMSCNNIDPSFQAQEMIIELQKRLENSEKQKNELQSKLTKLRSKSVDTSKLLDLYKETSKELEKVKKDHKECISTFNGLLEASQETSKSTIENLTAKLEKSELLLKEAELHRSEQSVLIYQLKSQLNALNETLSVIGDPNEVKKELEKLRHENEVKEVLNNKQASQIEMQQIRIRDLTQLLNQKEKQARIEQNENEKIKPHNRQQINKENQIHDKIQSKNNNLIVSSNQDAMETEEIDVDENDLLSFARDYGHVFEDTSENNESIRIEDEQEHSKSNAIESENESNSIQISNVTTASSQPSFSLIPLSNSQDILDISSRIDRSAGIDELEEEASNTKTTKKSSDSSHTISLPPSLSSTSISGNLKKNNKTKRNKKLAEIESQELQPVSGDLNLDIETLPTILSSEYSLSPVNVGWRPLYTSRTISKLFEEILLFGLETHKNLKNNHFNSSKPLEEQMNIESTASECTFQDLIDSETKTRISDLSSRICCAKPSIIINCLIKSTMNIFSEIVDQWNRSLMSEDLMLQIVEKGHFLEPLILNMIYNICNSSYSTSHIDFLDMILSRISRLVFGFESNQKEKLYQSDFKTSLFVHLYISICKNYGYLRRARTLLFDIIRENEEICVLQLLACVSSWPVVLEAQNPKKSFISTTIQSIIISALSSTTVDDPLIKKQKERFERIFGNQSTQFLETFSNQLVSCLISHLSSKEINFSDSHSYLQYGLEIIRSLELLGTQFGPNWLNSTLFSSILCPASYQLMNDISSTKTENISNDMNLLSLKIRLVIKGISVCGRVFAESKTSFEAFTATCNTLLTNIQIATRLLDFDSEIYAIKALLEMQICEHQNTKETLNFVCSWYTDLSPLQKYHVPENISKYVSL